jgi:DNA-binding MarR family transcriptional regulator/tetratricopeptide (TPR) repeat protein
MSSRFRREQLTVGRDAILLDTLDHLRSAADRKSKHHFLFLGPRGVGKSHLLAVIEDRIAADPRLATRLVVARFPEESVRTLSFADLLKQLVSILAINLTEEPHWKELSAKLEKIQDSNEVVDSVVPVLRRTNEAKKRTIVVMIENLNELFSKQIRQDQQIGAIRKFFMDKNGCLLIATAPMHFDAVTDVAQPFYDFFDTQTLQPFDKEQSVTLLHRTRELDGSNTNAIKDLSHCMMALHDMTDGNPRLIVMTCELIVRDGIESAREILLRLVDSISPTYQASLAEMAPQERAVMETLACMRDATPRTPANISSKLGISERHTSALLKRLVDARLLKFAISPDDKRSRSYCIRDGFFDIWLAIQSSEAGKRRILLLAELLESFYCKKNGPFLKSGAINDRFSYEPWPPESPSFLNDQQSTYLAFLHSMISEWVRFRNVETEELAISLNRMGPFLSEKTVSKALLLRIKTKLPETHDEVEALQLRLQSAYLHFLISEDETCKRELESVLEANRNLTPFLKDLVIKNIECMNNKISELPRTTSRYPNIFISYAWGDSTPSGEHRQNAVEILCDTLKAEGIPFQRDKDELNSGDSIREFMKRLSKGDKIIAVISEKYLLDSESCMMFELFKVFRRKDYEPNELQEVIIPIILNDAKKLIQTREGRISVAEKWKEKAIEQKVRLGEIDPMAKSSVENTDVNDMMEMVERVPDMLAAINDINIGRFQELANSNFAEVLKKLRDSYRSDESMGPVPPIDQSSVLALADRVGLDLAKQLEDASLFMHTKRIVNLYSQGCEWINAGGLHASPIVRRRLYVRLANALLLDSEEKRVPSQGLDDALDLLDLADQECSVRDDELDALTIATRLLIDHLRGDDSKSLDELKAIDHPVAFANRIRLLFLRGKIDEAFELVHPRELHVRWAEIAAAIYVRRGRLSDAIGICDSMRCGDIKGSADPNLVTIRYFRCLMLVAYEYFRRIFPEGRIRIDVTTEVERKGLTEITNLLRPIVSKVFGAGQVSNGIELRSLEIAFDAAYLTGESESASRIATLLASANPISTHVIRLVHAGFLKPDVDLVRRLKKDWPKSTAVSLSIIELIALHLDDPVTALEELESLPKGELDHDQKSRLASVLLTLYQREAGEIGNRSFALLAKVFGAEHYFLRMAEAISAMRQKDWPLAERLLNDRAASDDADWLGLRSKVLEQMGDLKSALMDLKKLCEITSSPDAMWRAVTIALEIEPKEIEFAVSILERLSRFPTERKTAERKLAEIGWKSGTDDGIRRAAQIYKNLYHENPNEPELAMNAAVCLRNLSAMDQAIAMLEDLERDHPEFVEGFLLHADILEAQSRAEDAFALLDLGAVRNRFWNEADFLQKYMHLGYKTAHEFEAHNAMCQIGLIEDGKPEQEKTLHAVNLEQFSDFWVGRREFLERIDEMVVRGQAPWTMHAFQEHTPILSAWAYRTQSLIPWGTISGRANFSTYASNAFFSKLSENGERHLEAIEPRKGTGAVVADISALVTLYKLGLLEKAADCFGKIYLPSAYRDFELIDAKRLQPHQLSKTEQSRRLFSMVVRRQIRRPSDGKVDAEVIDCQSQADPTSYSVGDVALCLKKSGLISKERYKQLAEDQSFVASGRQGIETLLMSGRCQFTLLAVQTLESAGLLDTLVEQYRVTLTQTAARELEQEQFAIDHQTKTARESRDLWGIVRDNNKFQYIGLPCTTASDDSVREANHGEKVDSLRWSLVSFDLAKERRLPLLADDRVLLTFAQNESDGRGNVAFSTLELLPLLENENLISQDERLQHTLQLIDWRYRFLKIDHPLLLHAAKMSTESGQTPGFQLKKIARYIQDCMLDVGLFGGAENVTSRVSMAQELYTYWTRTVARFINLLWTDESITDEVAESFTRWSIDSLLPTLPISGPTDVQIRLSESQAKLVLVWVLSERGTNPNASRSARLMSVLQDALSLSQSELSRTVFSLIEIDDESEETGMSQEKWSRVQQVYRRGIAKHALSPFHHDGSYQIDSRGIALLEASKSLRRMPVEQEIPQYILNVLKNHDDDYLIKTAPPGPMVFHRDPESAGASVFEASDLLMHPNSKARESVIAYLSQLGTRSEGSMSERLKKAMKDQSKKIFQKRAIHWYPATEGLLEIIENDWQLNLAGFRQALFANKQDFVHYWYRCSRPRIHPASTLPASSFHACTDRASMNDRVLPEVSLDAAKNGIVRAYCNHLGHLPLVDDWSLSNVAERSKIHISTEELLALATHDNYLSAYHGCAALVARWDKLNQCQQKQTAEHLSDFICLSRNSDLSTRRGRFWTCLNRLANHFLAWIPLYGPELGDDNSASLAWWMAERLAKVVCEDVERKQTPQSNMQFVLERSIDPLVHFSFQLNQLIRGGATGSVFHANTSLIQHGGPFFSALIASFKLDVGAIYSLLSEQARTEIDKWMVVNTLHQSVGVAQKDSLLFGNYETDIQTTIDQWVKRIDVNEEAHAVMSKLRSDCATLPDNNALTDLLSSFDSLGPDDQALWLNRLKVSVWRDATPLEPILSLLRDPMRSRVLVRSMKRDQLSMAIELLLSMQQSGGDVWKYELPHRLVGWLDYIDTLDEKFLIFNGIVCSAIAGESPSAIDQVREREDCFQLKDAFTFQRDRLESARTIVPRWTWSRLRVYLDKLR